MTLVDGRLKLGPRLKPNGKLRGIDPLFEPLAREDALTIGVVLSGTNFDGTVGLGAIKAHSCRCRSSEPT